MEFPIDCLLAPELLVRFQKINNNGFWQLWPHLITNYVIFINEIQNKGLRDCFVNIELITVGPSITFGKMQAKQHINNFLWLG